MAQVSKDITIAEAISIDQGIIQILMANGMHCVGCPSSQKETLEEAAFVHGMDIEKLMNSIQEYLATKK